METVNGNNSNESNNATLQKKSAMIWSEEMDFVMLKEVAAEGVMTLKAKSRDRGIAWQTVASHLNEQPAFDVSARSVRDRFNNLVKKHKVRIAREERASGGGGEGLKEWESLLEELMLVGDETEKKADEENVEKREMVEKEREKALEMRKIAMETMGETRERQGNEKGKRRRSTSQMAEWLDKMIESKKKITEEDRKVREEERKVKEDENKLQQEKYNKFLQQMHVSQQQQFTQFRATEQDLLQQQQQQSQQFTMMQRQMLFMMEEQKKQTGLMFEFLKKSEK